MLQCDPSVSLFWVNRDLSSDIFLILFLNSQDGEEIHEGMLLLLKVKCNVPLILAFCLIISIQNKQLKKKMQQR